MMSLVVEVGSQQIQIEVPDDLPVEASDFFARMDRDMDGGWQMSRWWVPDPDETQRCQIVADKLLNAIQQKNTEFGMLMCAYILNLKPDTRRIIINTDGEIQGNQFLADH